MAVKKKGIQFITASIAALCIVLSFFGAKLSSSAANDYNSENISEENVTYRSGGGYALTGQLYKADYITQIYDASNGLPTSDSNYILGASDGTIWIGGYSGVIRYDGTTFDYLDGSDGLTSARAIFEDSKGRIWVGTNDSGVVVIDKSTRINLTSKDGLTASSIRSFAEDATGDIYVATTAGVCYVDSSMAIHVIDDSRINDERVLKLQADSNGAIYGQTKSGRLFKIENDMITQTCSSEDIGAELITTFLIDPDNEENLYICTNSKYIYHGRFGDNASEMNKLSVTPLNGIHWISYDCNRVWVSSTSQIGYLDWNGTFNLVDNTPMNNSIEMMTSDYQGNMWFASSTQGVMKLVTSNFTNINNKYGLPEEVVNVTYAFNDMLYIGTDNGLRILDSNMKPIETKYTRCLSGSRVRCIVTDSDYSMWVGTYTNDLGLVCRTCNNKIIKYTTRDGLPSNKIRCLNVTKDQSILVGTDDGVAVIKDGKVVKRYDRDDGMKNAVCPTIEEGFDGELLIGTDGDGIYIADDNGLKKIGAENGLTSDVIQRIIKDEERGIYWIITSNSIEYMRNGELVNITSFPFKNNYDLKIDGLGNIWITSAYGLYYVKLNEMLTDNVTDYRTYTITSGLPSVPTANSRSALDANGVLYIAGRGGVAAIDTNDYYDEPALSKLGISTIFCDGEQLFPNEDGSYTIPAECERVQIMPAIMDYTTSNPMIHMYLEGTGDNGVTSPKNKLTSLEYTNLDYGTHNLHIQVINEKANAVRQEAVFTINKTPRFHELLASKILFGMLVVAFVGFIIWRVMLGTIIRKQYEQIRQARDDAERANTAKSRFLANISHEIRTPINTILGMDEMILREDATDVPKGYFLSVINYASDIKNATDSLLGLINDLLDISKIESGKMHLVEQEYDTKELLKSIVTMIRVRAAEKDLLFTVDIDESLPKRLYGDSGKIKQIILNLLTNAVKYTQKGGFTLKIIVEEKTNDTCKLRISVKDSGIGVKKEDLEKLFTAYERLDEEKNSGIQGTGLGLDISRRFAELMQSKLWCESTYGEGSEFIFVLDQKIIERKAIGEFSMDDNEISAGPYVPRFVAPDAEILVVDDNSMNLAVIKGLLKATKMFVTTAESGEECLEKIKYGDFNVVLLDHMMPGMDGIETLSKIRETHPDLPVYALTANSTAGEEFYKSKGFDGYLAKPIDSVVLEKTILKHLPESIVMINTEEEEEDKEPEVIPEDLMWIYDVKEINVEDGINNSGGASLFVFSLNLFYETIDGNADVIEKAYKEKDIKLYTVKVHALKSSARIVGAGELSSLAEKLEEAGNKKNMEFINNSTAKLLSDYRAFKDILSRLQKEPSGSESNLQMIDPDELKDAYTALKELIEQMDYDGVEMVIGQLEEYKLPEEDANRISEITKLLKIFDWDGMEKKISEV